MGQHHSLVMLEATLSMVDTSDKQLKKIQKQLGKKLLSGSKSTDALLLDTQ